VDFQETYAPITNNIVTSIVCQVCTARGFYMATFDVTAAFLEGTADRKLFARLPTCISPTNERVEIIGNWYGLKQGPRFGTISSTPYCWSWDFFAVLFIRVCIHEIAQECTFF
jgi:hypothetical protein